VKPESLRVQLADHGRDVGLEQAVAGDDGGEAELEYFLVRHRDHEQAGRHDDRAEQDGSLVAQYLVGDVTAEDGCGIDQREVCTINQVGRLFAGRGACVKLRNDVQHQRPSDSVEREALPELGHEQHPERGWMAHHLFEFWNRDLGPRRVCSTAHAASPLLLTRKM